MFLDKDDQALLLAIEINSSSRTSVLSHGLRAEADEIELELMQ